MRSALRIEGLFFQSFQVMRFGLHQFGLGGALNGQGAACPVGGVGGFPKLGGDGGCGFQIGGADGVEIQWFNVIQPGPR